MFRGPARVRLVYLTPPCIRFLLGCLAGASVSLLYAAYQLFPLPADPIHVILAQLTPLLANGTFKLFKLTFKLIPVHRKTSLAPQPSKGTTALDNIDEQHDNRQNQQQMDEPIEGIRRHHP
jgi:hypothetical protein